MSNFSSAALAVLTAYNEEARPEPHHQREALAAALRALTQELKYIGITGKNILAIATELEGPNG